ncbi:hypothetical protein F5Y05DRAFT_420545 [Hypoxylon sp. FL0543]|nr:hypothetical protein F5Y05DRAFT_420545 [Hypoxylon sp. FL0543]
MSVSSEVRDIITRKKQRYCRFADTNQWQKMVEIVLPEATYKFYECDGSLVKFEGIEFDFPSTAEWIKFFGSTLFPRSQGIHLIGPGELKQTGPDEVKAIWSVIYHACVMESSGESHQTGGGYYYETWKQKAGDWFIQDLKFEKTYFRLMEGS